MRLLLQWILTAIALLIVSRIVPGFHVNGLWPALIAALVIGLLNATVGLLLKIITFPLSILTLGLFLLVINGIMILVASDIVPDSVFTVSLQPSGVRLCWLFWEWSSGQL